MSVKTDLAIQYMGYMRDQNMDAAIAMLAEDVTMTVPMQGTMTGKPAVEQAMRRAPGGGGGNLNWTGPTEDGEDVKIVGTGGPYGPIRIVLGFNAENQVNKIDIGLGS